MWRLLLLACALCLSLRAVDGGHLSVFVRNGRVKDTDSWPRGESDPIAFIRVPGKTDWRNTDEDENDNSPEWNENLDFGAWAVPYHVRLSALFPPYVPEAKSRTGSGS